MGGNTIQEVPPDVDFTIPNWAAKPPTGTHLDVYKGEKLLQKLMIDEKRCYFFGRNPQMCDIAVEHASCSRVHAALLYHKHLSRFFLIDLGSAHGTFIANVRLEPNKAEQVQPEQIFRFGASTRRYTLREKPNSAFYRNASDSKDENASNADGTNNNSGTKQISLPEKEEELENLTEYNTALNRRIAALTVPDENFNFKRQKSVNVNFKDEEEIINPEDIDPSVGKFRNLVQTAVISTKRPKMENDHYNLNAIPSSINSSDHPHPTLTSSVHQQPHGTSLHPQHQQGHSAAPGFSSIGAKLGLNLSLNIAPEIELYPPSLPPAGASKSSAVSATSLKRHDVSFNEQQHLEHEDLFDDNCPKKKKYAKEAWPGKKPALFS